MAGSADNLEITPPNEWTRYSLTFTATANITQIGINNTADAIDALIWGPQVEEGYTATEYIKTTSTINSAPRFTHERVETGNQLASSNHFNLLASNQSSLRYSNVNLNGGTFLNQMKNELKTELLEIVSDRIRNSSFDFTGDINMDPYTPVSYTHLTLPTTPYV